MKDSKQNTRVNLLKIHPEDLLLESCTNSLADIWDWVMLGREENLISVSNAVDFCFDIILMRKQVLGAL